MPDKGVNLISSRSTDNAGTARLVALVSFVAYWLAKRYQYFSKWKMWSKAMKLISKCLDSE